jgi:hypothetical protein
MDQAAFAFKLLRQDGLARRGEVITPRGTIRTPAFMPVGTAATVKALYLDQVEAAGADIRIISCCGPALNALRGSVGFMPSWAGGSRS